MRKVAWISALCVISACATSGQHEKSPYPAHWWSEAKDNIPAWEITPDKAKAGQVILSKRNELGLLSNFAPTPFLLDGARYASVEGFWQMMKYPESDSDPRASKNAWKHKRSEVAQMSGFVAKRAGKEASKQMKAAGISWVSYQAKRLEYKGKDKNEYYRLIRRAMVAKLEQNPDIQYLLLRTGSLELLPDHQQSKTKTRAYDYHKIWMELRSELKARKNKIPFLPGWSTENKRRILKAVGQSVYQKHPIAVFDGDGTLWHADLPREFLDYQIKNKRLKHCKAQLFL